MRYNPWYYKIDGVLIKKMKPCLPDNYVHIKRWDGCYKVYGVTITHFSILKRGEVVWLPWSEFSCLKGDGKSILSEVKRNLKLIKASLCKDIVCIDALIKTIKM